MRVNRQTNGQEEGIKTNKWTGLGRKDKQMDRIRVDRQTNGQEVDGLLERGQSKK